MDPYGEATKWRNEIQAIKAFSSGTYIKVNDRLVPGANLPMRIIPLKEKMVGCKLRGAGGRQDDSFAAHLCAESARRWLTGWLDGWRSPLALHVYCVTESLGPTVLLVLSLSQPVPRSVRIVFCTGHSLQVPHSWLPSRFFKWISRNNLRKPPECTHPMKEII